MIKQLVTAVKDKFNADATLSASLAGGLWFNKAKDKVEPPYGVFYVLGGTRDEIMGSAQRCVKNVDVQFNLFGSLNDGGAQIAELSEDLTDCFDWLSLTIAGYNSVFVKPNGLPIIQYIDNIWQATIYYIVGIEKT